MNMTSTAYYEAARTAPLSFSEYDASQIEWRKTTPAEARAIAEKKTAERKANVARIATERRVVRHFIRTAKAAGFDVHSVFDGEERVKTRNETEAMDAVFSVEDATVYFTKTSEPGRARECLVVVLGNGSECLSDMSAGRADWDAVVTAAMDYADSQDA